MGAEQDAFSGLNPEALFRIDHSLADETEEQYLQRKAAAITRGEPTWLIGNFEADSAVYRLWYETRLVALVEDLEDGAYRVYVRNPAGACLPAAVVEEDTTMLDDFETLSDAISAAESHWGIQPDTN